MSADELASPYCLHGCADDTQLYIHCQPDETAASVAVLERCIKDVDDWMSANGLKLNMDKTELLWVGTKYILSKLNGSGPSLQLKSSTVNSCQHVHVLGVHFSSDLCLDKHVSHVSSSCFHQLRQLQRIQRSLDKESAATLVHAFVTTRVDYCNAVLAAAPKTATDKLQRVRVTTGPGKSWKIRAMSCIFLNYGILKLHGKIIINK